MLTTSTSNPHRETLSNQPDAHSITFQAVSYPHSTTQPAPYSAEDVLPLALAPSSKASITDLVSAIKYLSRTSTIRSLLTRNGAIYFKDLGIESADEFSQFAAAFGWTPHEDIGNPVRRTVHAFNVATANEGPNTQPVYPHNEFGLSPHYPAYVLFFCASTPETGGETPINNSIVLYKALKEAVPEFIEEVERKGVQYQLFYPNTPLEDITSAGTSVLQAYGKHVLPSDSAEVARSKIEREIRRLPTATWQWEDQSETNLLGNLRVFQKLPAMRIHEHTGQKAFFNNVVSRFLNAIDAGSLEPPHINRKGNLQPPAFYGDGSQIPRKYLECAVNNIKETRSLVTWAKGDVLLLDNHAVQHAREPWTGPRKLLASLWDEPTA